MENKLERSPAGRLMQHQPELQDFPKSFGGQAPSMVGPIRGLPDFGPLEHRIKALIDLSPALGNPAMQINWNQNPLGTQIQLDANDLERLRLRLTIQQYEDILGVAAYCLAEDSLDVERARRAVRWEYWCTDTKSPLEQHVDKLVDLYVQELQAGHEGDCTGVSCACMKCHAEEILGINTIAGLSKSDRQKLQKVMREQTSLAAAITELELQSETEKLVEWLKTYQAAHFS